MDMPKKIRQLKADLKKAGFSSRPGKGSHIVFCHDANPALRVTVSGRDGDDADKYQVDQVYKAIKKVKGEI
jgi:predicted RNA binding protein YcfA (HicA-like mRNA interferase family)